MQDRESNAMGNKELEALENFLLSDDFAELSAKTNKLNIFNVLKLENAEIRHSNFLGWLLNPNETHMMLDYFLKEFLKMAVKDHLDNPDVAMQVSDIVLNNFVETQVTLEKLTDEGRRIDILLENSTNQFVCVVENKIWSDEGCNQLEDYYKYINNHEKYKNYKHKLFIFLTPKTEYDCTKLHKNYIRFDYRKVCQVIDKLLKKYKGISSDDVIYFIENYKEMVERNIMGKCDKEVMELCTKLYKTYGQTIDLIVQHGNPKTCVLSIFDEILSERKDLVLIESKKDGFLFLPNKINNKDIFNMYDFNNYVVHLNCWGYAWGKEGLFLEVLVSSNNDKFAVNSNDRKSLINHIATEMNKSIKDKIHFIREDEEYTPSRELFNLLSVEEYSSCKDREEIKEKIKSNLKKSGYINALRNALNSWNS